MSTSLRHSSRRAATLAGVLALVFVPTVQTVPGPTAPRTAAVVDRAQASPTQSDAQARGEYLVRSVAMCVQCHSPRDQRGNLIKDQELTGAPMPVRGPAWSREWAYTAPALAGLSGFTDDQIVQLLTEGRAGDRPAPKPPMPPFRMTRQDAEAVAAYLRTR